MGPKMWKFIFSVNVVYVELQKKYDVLRKDYDQCKASLLVSDQLSSFTSALSNEYNLLITLIIW